MLENIKNNRLVAQIECERTVHDSIDVSQPIGNKNNLSVSCHTENVIIFNALLQLADTYTRRYTYDD